MASSLNTLYILLALVFLSEVAYGQELQCPNNYTSTTTIRRLKQHAFCKYDRLIRPVRRHDEAVQLKIRLVLKRLDFDEKNDVLNIHSWFLMLWKDYHIIWNATDFDGIDNLKVFSYYLWIPDLDVYNTADSNQLLGYFYARCIVHANGDVICVPSKTFKTSCSADLTRWPYDSHTCKMIVGSWTHKGEEINLTMLPKAMVTSELDLNREWELVSTNAKINVLTFDCCPNETYPHAEYVFVLQRHSGVFAATIIIPAVVLMMLTLLTFWIDPSRKQRLYLAAVGIFCHFIFLQYLGDILPSNGEKVPLLVTFYRDSLILTTMALMTSVLGKSLKSSSQPAPLWATGISSFVLHSRLGQILVSTSPASKMNSDVSGGLVDGVSNPADSGWTSFTAVIDMFCFFIALLVYFILILGFIP